MLRLCASLHSPRATLVPLFALALGCAGDLRVPESPPGDPCETYEDCVRAGEVACGPLRACVDGVCEASPTLYRACR